MTERPIIFGAESVRAILAGRKSQTRRVLSENDRLGYPHSEIAEASTDGFITTGGLPSAFGTSGLAARFLPGVVLWVREMWAKADPLRFVDHCRDGVAYRADDGAELHATERWRSPIYMPRWASRITLRVTAVRVERLQAITEADAHAEGVAAEVDALDSLAHLRGADACRAVPSRPGSARDAYRCAWDMINGKTAPWTRNPWVFVIEFERVTR